MRIRNLLIAVAVLAIAVPGMASAAKPASSGFKVTGGGQIIAEDAQGAGDTVGFNAHEVEGDDFRSPGDDDDKARGQFQYVPRGQSAGTNQEVAEKFHGVVTCLISGGEAVENENSPDDEQPEQVEEELSEGMARFGGYFRDEPNRFFTVDVTDNGQGGDAADDLILVRETDAPCADNPEDEDAHDPEDLLRLGRGNVKIHKNPDGETASASANAKAARAMLLMAL